MKFAAVVRAFDTVVALRDAARRFKGGDPASGGNGTIPLAGGAISRHIEARLTNVVVAALKEAFARDHARLELERAQLDEERRRAEAAMRMELRRQVADRELSRMRLLGATAFVGWIASVALLIARLGSASPLSRGILVAGWLLLLGSLWASFNAQARISRYVPDADQPFDSDRVAASSLGLVIAGLAVSATSLLF